MMPPGPPPAPPTKAAWRKVAYGRRRAMSPGRRRAAAAAACRRLVGWVLHERLRHIGLYRAAGSELDVGPAVVALAALGVRCYLPPPRRHLVGPPALAAWLPASRGGGGPTRLWPAGRLQLLVLPVVAVDLAGRRLGQGGGWYDRLLAACGGGGGGRPRRVAVAFACQLVDALPVQPHDVGVERVFTERGARRAGGLGGACGS